MGIHVYIPAKKKCLITTLTINITSSEKDSQYTFNLPITQLGATLRSNTNKPNVSMVEV